MPNRTALTSEHASLPAALGGGHDIRVTQFANHLTALSCTADPFIRHDKSSLPETTFITNLLHSRQRWTGQVVRMLTDMDEFAANMAVDDEDLPWNR